MVSAYYHGNVENSCNRRTLQDLGNIFIHGSFQVFTLDRSRINRTLNLSTYNRIMISLAWLNEIILMITDNS
jgi:hypothetical protein